jgi:hypothetical protein
MKTIFHTGLAVLYTFSCFGQVKSSLDTINYNLFKSYNVDYRSLYILGNNNFAWSKFQEIYSANSAGLQSNYFAYSNLEKKQTSKFTVARLNYNNEKSKDGVYSFNSFIVLNDRQYYKPNSFYEINPSLNVFSRYSAINAPIEQKKELFATLNPYVDIRIGKGRINPISEIFAVAFIIDELKKEGIDVSRLGQAEMFEFGQVLVGISNKRILDSRRARVQQFIETNKFISKYITSNDDEKMMTSAIIMDNIFFVFNQARSSGQRWSFGIKQGGDLSTNNSFFQQNRYSLESSVDHNYAKALSRYFNFESALKFGVSYYSNSQFINKSLTGIVARAQINVSYHPISRTAITSRFEFTKYQGRENLYLNTDVNYFINYFTNLQFKVGYSFVSQKELLVNFNISHAMY